ncbi:MAG: prenyltransferase/squalene oxidase repeat-containing protein [Sphingomonadales bacterium]|jgi:hypothetical protein
MSKRLSFHRLFPEGLLAAYYDYQKAKQLCPEGRALRARDRKATFIEDIGNETAIAVVMDWLCRAQDHSATRDGGVARDFSLIDGWASSYPETTGYIIPTLLTEAEQGYRSDLSARAQRMVDWLISIQLDDGAFQGGTITQTPVIPVTFNTGQILIGLAAAADVSSREDYSAAMHKAASWLRDTQDEDGAWRAYATPYAKPGDKVYETHVSWGLFEAERVAPGHGYGEAGLRQVRWALRHQKDNGWFDHCCLTKPNKPLTHTLGYVLRGILEAYRLSNDEAILKAGIKTADALKDQLGEDGRLAGRFYSNWRPAVSWVCMTGSAQISTCWMMLYEWTGDAAYFEAAQRTNSFLRRTLILDGSDGVRGGIRGSFPISGDYGRWEFLNWAAKFTIDAFRREQDLVQKKPPHSRE